MHTLLHAQSDAPRKTSIVEGQDSQGDGGGGSAGDEDQGPIRWRKDAAHVDGQKGVAGVRMYVGPTVTNDRAADGGKLGRKVGKRNRGASGEVAYRYVPKDGRRSNLNGPGQAGPKEFARTLKGRAEALWR